MTNRFAGVTLDFYDDNGDTLKKLFPPYDKLPGVIKTADIHAKDELDHEDFALIMNDGGTVLRKYACHDPGTTAISVIYFMEHGNKLPSQAQKLAAAGLTKACKRFGLAAPVIMEKRGSQLTAEEVPQFFGTLPVVDVTGQRPEEAMKTAQPTSDADYALVLDDGRRLYPINSWDLIKKAEDYFQQEGARMHPELRRQYCVKLAAKAAQVGFPLDEKIKEAGATTLAPLGQLKAAIEMRKVACAPGPDRKFLDDFVKIAHQIDPTAYAETLKRFDIQHGLDSGWNQLYPDPWASTFGLKKEAEILWEQGNDRMSREQLLNLSENHTTLLQDIFSYDFLRDFIKDPVGTWEKLPLINKRTLARLADNLSHDGGSEGSTTNNESMRF